MQTTQHELVLDTAAVARQQDDDGVEEAPGVVRTTLWHDRTRAAGTLTLAPGAALDEHTHTGHAHHVLVVRGTAEVLGRRLDAGSYWYVPAGVPHALTAVGEEPCELFWVYEPASG